VTVRLRRRAQCLGPASQRPGVVLFVEAAGGDRAAIGRRGGGAATSYPIATLNSSVSPLLPPLW